MLVKSPVKISTMIEMQISVMGIITTNNKT
jgi:hypothetical protein